jgi:hypothetical protein
VYTVFSSWDLIPPSVEPEGTQDPEPSQEAEGSQDSGLVYAAGPLAPMAIDLTPFLTQDSLRVPGRYTLSWELPGTQEDTDVVDTADSLDEVTSAELNLILEETIMTLFSPNLGLIIQVNGI